MYKIVRSFCDSSIPNRTIKKRLTLEEAQEYCRNPETSWKTCKEYRNRKRTERFGPWFDCYVET